MSAVKPQAKERISIAQAKLREYLRDNRAVTLTRAMRWLNNQRVAGEACGLDWSYAQAIFAEVRAAPPGQKVLPVIVKPADVRQPLRVPLYEVAHPPPAQSPPIDIPIVPKPLLDETVARSRSPEGTALRLKRIEDHSLSNPKLNSNDLYEDCRKRFGIGVNATDILRILRVVRDVADLPAPAFKHHQPKDKTVPDLVKPAADADPNDLLKGAGLKLKHLCAVMKWSAVKLTVNADGSMSYDATPAPVMAMKGEIKL